MASAIHDVGKISIPEEILNKPGKLTAEEFETMKTHTVIGSKMLSDLPIEQFHSPLAKVAYEICRWHHERYDGKGYPDGLKGEETPIAAQVVALADVYDALTSERCYKKAFSHEEAFVMILEGKCGVVNPILLQCLSAISDRLKKACTNIDLEPGVDKIQFDETDYSKASHTKKQAMPLAQPEYMRLLYVDPLTKVYNRRYYKEYVQDNFNIEAAALIDVNNLEQINADYGRKVGDLVLQRTAQQLLTLIRRNDHLIRYGGDAFLIGFSSMTKHAFGLRMEEIQKSFDALTIDGYPQLHMIINVGGIYGSENPKVLFNMIEDILHQLKDAKKQVPVCYLDEKEKKLYYSALMQIILCRAVIPVPVW